MPTKLLLRTAYVCQCCLNIIQHGECHCGARHDFDLPGFGWHSESERDLGFCVAHRCDSCLVISGGYRFAVAQMEVGK